MRHPYAGRIAGLATKHDKVPLVGPAMSRHLGLDVVEVAVDTDTLGTFTGEIPRDGTPWEVAVRKARLGMEASGLPLGFASEGSFGPSDASPFLVADHELVVLVDDELGIVIGEIEVDLMITSMRVHVRAQEEVPETLLRTAGFPDHGLIVRSTSPTTFVMKGIHDVHGLREAVDRCIASSPDGSALVESDFRAHHHPTRRSVIAKAAERLATRLATLCPECRAPGWGVTRRDPGAPCSWCRHPTRATAIEHWECTRCGCHDAREVDHGDGVDPSRCAMCNP